MHLNCISVALGIAAATIGVATHAGVHRDATKERARAAAGMQVVVVTPKAGEPGHGWRYFSDPARLAPSSSVRVATTTTATAKAHSSCSSR